MLRMLFGEQPREWTGISLETVRAIEQFAAHSSRLASRLQEQGTKFRTYEIWAEGLLRSMDELEQSGYAARKYAHLIQSEHMDELSPEDLINYHRHVYFDKNAYIRVFALLDKLGTLLNHLLSLRTERVKSHFSYFTVLRNMRENQLHTELMKPLNDLKERHQGAMNRLRSRRNLEIHQMNAELKDDLNHSLANSGGRRTIENLTANMDDLDHSWQMVLCSLHHSFQYACKRLRKME